MSSYLLTSESVSEGHPDKVCDRISDSILDDLLSEDPEARVAVEALATTQRVVLAGEVSSKKNIIMNTDRFERVAREVVCEIGYRQKGFHYKHMTVDCFIHEQSHDIAIGIDSGKEGGQEGAGDQGIVFGYACKELDGMHYMPASIYYSHRILRLLSKTRKADSFSILEPDSKSQVTLVYEDGRPVRADTIVVSTQHSSDASQKDVHELVMHHLEMVFPKGWIPPKDRIYINPTGRFIIGGPDGDTGLTGRKIIVDTYGERAPHGGGAFSGKDPTKVDRSGAYMARYLAKNIVATGKTDRCLVQIAYAIGVSYPLAIYLHMGHGHDTNEKKLIRALLNREIVDLSPRGIREHLGLGRPIYTPTSAYGHFGRKPEANGSFSWERLDLVDAILSVIK